MKKSILMLAAALSLAACADKTYTLVGTVPGGDLDGRTVYLEFLDAENETDSTVIADGMFTFGGTAAAARPAMVKCGRQRASLVIEPGDITVALAGRAAVSGTPSNDRLAALSGNLEEMSADFNEKIRAIYGSADLSEDEKHARIDALSGEGCDMAKSLCLPVVANNDALGAIAMQLLASFVEDDEFDSLYNAAGDVVRNSLPLKKIYSRHENRRLTAEGMPFVDFAVENGGADGQAVSFSDYIGRGKYVLVDFWASWCGPCRREIPVIAEVYEKYAGEKFGVLGVAVWDERENTLGAIAELGMPWPQIIDAGSVPTDLYGIDGIPHIILFGPDGTIVARGLRGEALKQRVAEALAQ